MTWLPELQTDDYGGKALVAFVLLWYGSYAWSFVSNLWRNDRTAGKEPHGTRSYSQSDGQRIVKQEIRNSGPRTRVNTGFVLPSWIHHARMLPAKSAHAFRYPTLYFAVSLKHLEKGHCDLGWDRRLFCWTDSSQERQRLALTALEASDYLAAPTASHLVAKGSWLFKLGQELHSRGWLKSPQDLEDDCFDIWAVTMPSFLGYHGINPLTVYYIYRSDGISNPDNKRPRGSLWLCLLEVHNTFTERHLYILPTAEGEDRELTLTATAQPERTLKERAREEKARGDGLSWLVQKRRGDYDHQWTFPRSFHVSPFNDRGGYYRLYLKDLWHSSEGLPSLDVRLLLMEPQTEGDEFAQGQGEGEIWQPLLRKKILATLSSYEHASQKQPRPLTAGNLLHALARQPFDLVLTFVRIAWQAAKLHYGSPKLDVYNKPEMSVASARSDRSLRPRRLVVDAPPFDGVGWPPSLNKTQLERVQSSGIDDRSSPEAELRNGSLMWTQPSSSDEEGKRRFCELVKRSNVAVRLVRPDGHSEKISPERRSGHPEGELTVYLLSPAFFSDLLLYGNPRLALLLGSRIGRRWGVSDPVLLERLFDETDEAKQARGAYCKGARSWAAWVRRQHEQWAERQAQPYTLKRTRVGSIGHGHSLLDEMSASNWNLAISLLTLHYGLAAQEAAFRWMRARYVPGTEPWLEWRHGAQLVAREESQP